MSLDTIRAHAVSKLAWIKKQQRKLRQQERETPREYLDRESHFVWGSRYLLKVVEADAAPLSWVLTSQEGSSHDHRAPDRRQPPQRPELHRKCLPIRPAPPLRRGEGAGGGG